MGLCGGKVPVHGTGEFRRPSGGKLRKSRVLRRESQSRNRQADGNEREFRQFVHENLPANWRGNQFGRLDGTIRLITNNDEGGDGVKKSPANAGDFSLKP